jgi:hypothetical protein
MHGELGALSPLFPPFVDSAAIPFFSSQIKAASRFHQKNNAREAISLA